MNKIKIFIRGALSLDSFVDYGDYMFRNQLPRSSKPFVPISPKSDVENIAAAWREVGELIRDSMEAYDKEEDSSKCDSAAF